jgi:hypothetical protein
MTQITDDFLTNFRKETEDRWSKKAINNRIYGFQIQPGTKWLPGLTEHLIDQYESQLKFKFPHDMRRLLRYINGTDQPTLNIYGSSGEPHEFGPGVYSYPRDIEHIIARLQSVAVDRSEIATDLLNNGFDLKDSAKLLPIYSHRYVVCDLDQRSSTVLSICGTDAIIYGDCLRDYLQNEFLDGGQQNTSLNCSERSSSQ